MVITNYQSGANLIVSTPGSILLYTIKTAWMESKDNKTYLHVINDDGDEIKYRLQNISSTSTGGYIGYYSDKIYVVNGIVRSIHCLRVEE